MRHGEPMSLIERVLAFMDRWYADLKRESVTVKATYRREG
jgi:hypothetical protein